MIVNYQTPATTTRLGRLVARAMAASTGRKSVWAAEPWRSTSAPAAMAGLLGRHGYAVTSDEDLLTAAKALGVPARRARSLANGRVLVASVAAG